MMQIDANSWYYSPDHGQLCQVIESQTLWAVRHYRLAQLTHEEQAWREQLSRMAEVQPELIPLLIIQVIQGM